MNIVHKYKIDLGETSHTMPKGAVLLDAQIQDNKFVFWVLVDLDEENEELRTFVVTGTGTKFNAEGFTYVSTVQDGIYVWHIFEKDAE